MFEPRSYLQKLADPWVHTRFLGAAAAATNPVERLQAVVTFFIAGAAGGGAAARAARLASCGDMTGRVNHSL
jgi:hypothetical protein